MATNHIEGMTLITDYGTRDEAEAFALELAKEGVSSVVQYSVIGWEVWA